MFIKKKLRDLSEEEFIDWYHRTTLVICKRLFDGSLLDQEVEIEVPDPLTDEEKEYLKGILNALKVKGKLKSIHVHNSFISLHFSTKSGIDELPLPFTRNLPYSFLGLISSIHYTPEELGL